MLGLVGDWTGALGYQAPAVTQPWRAKAGRGSGGKDRVRGCSLLAGSEAPGISPPPASTPDLLGPPGTRSSVCPGGGWGEGAGTSSSDKL